MRLSVLLLGTAIASLAWAQQDPAKLLVEAIYAEEALYDLDRAAQLYEQAFKQAAPDPLVRSRAAECLAWCLERQGREEDARKWRQQVTHHTKPDPGGNWNRPPEGRPRAWDSGPRAPRPREESERFRQAIAQVCEGAPDAPSPEAMERLVAAYEAWLSAQPRGEFRQNRPRMRVVASLDAQGELTLDDGRAVSRDEFAALAKESLLVLRVDPDAPQEAVAAMVELALGSPSGRLFIERRSAQLPGMAP